MRREYTITLRWPDRRLSPNARVDRRKVSGIRAAARREAGLLCIAEGARNLKWAGADVMIVFRPPDRHRRDVDNMLGSIKSDLDGIADATGVDDATWTLTLVRGDPVKGGMVIVRLSEREE